MSNKRLGQNFLINRKIVADIIDAGELSKKDIVLEVGPGKGILTEALAKKSKKVIAIEKDSELVEYLKEKLKNQKNIEVVYGDILKISSPSPLAPRPHKLIANIPYYITSRFLRIFLSQAKLRPKLMVLMLQKEVAERIVTRDSKESLLSLSVKAYGNPKIIKIVRRGNFFPPPKVDSAIIKISDISDKWFKKNKVNEERFFEFLRKAFQQKRKMLRRSLGKNLPEQYSNRRPEELKLEDWVVIYLSLSQ